MVKFAREAEAAGWAVALRAGTVDAPDGESSLGVWECEASGTAHDSRQGGESLAVLSLMWTQEDGRKRWTFDTERSGAEFGGRILTGYVTLEDYQRALSQARVRQVDPVAEAAETAAREAAERAKLEAEDAAKRAEYAADAAEYARQWERATDRQAERFGDWVADSGVLWLGDYAAAWRTWSATESAAAEAYAAVMAECRAHREEISRLWSVDRMEREHVPDGAALTREAAESATREVKTLMTRAAEAEGTPGAADMIRREVLPALVSAREAVEAYHAHRAEETREHTLKAAADADQARPVVAVPQSDAAADAPAMSTATSDIDTDAVARGVALVDRDRTPSKIEWHRDAPESSAPVDLVTLAREAATRGWSVKVGRSMTGREGLGWALTLSGEVAVPADGPVTVVYTGMWTGRPKFHRAVKRVGSTRMDRPLMWPEFRKVVRTAELVTTAPEAGQGDAPQATRVATRGETMARGIAPRAGEDSHSHLGGSGMLGADVVRRAYERADQGDGAPVAYAADVVSDPGGVDAWESEGGVLAGGGRPLLICHGKGGGVFPVAFRGPYEGTVRLSRDVRLRRVRGELAAARNRVESAEYIAQERAAWSADMREVEREARRSAGVLGDHVWLSAEHAGDWRTHAYDVALAADRAARNARDAVRALEREESAIVTEQGLAGERVAAAGAHLARLHAGEVQAGRGAWLSEDGEAAMVFKLPWDASHDVEQIPGGVPADQITGYAAFVDVLGDAVAARDERRALTAKDVPGRNRMGGHGPDTDLRRAIVNASKGLDAKPWKAPKVPEAGTPLDAETLATWDTVGDVVAETEAAPGVWLPMAAVSLAEVSMANGWTVAMQRDGGTVVVRAAGVAVKNGEPLPYELRAVWIDGVWNEDQSGAWVSGRRVTAKRALLWSAPVKVGRSGTHQEPSLLSTVQHKAEPGTLGVRTPEWSAPPPAGVSDPGSMEGWEDEGGVLANGDTAAVEHPGVTAAAASTDESLSKDGAPVEPLPVPEVTAVSTDEHGVSTWEITGDARGRLTMGAEVKVPGSAVWLRVESVRLAHGGWCEVSGTAVNGMGAGRPWVSERVDHSDRSVPYVVARGHRPPVNAPKAPEATTALEKPIDAGVSGGQTNEEVQADHGAPASAAEKAVGQDATTDQPDGTGTSATSQDDGREQQHESAPEESPSQDAPASDGDGLGTVDLFESFGLTRPDRVPAPTPQEEPAPEADAASTGVEDGRMTVEEVQSEAAAAEPDAGIVDERGLAAAGWRSLAHAADLDAAAVLRHYEPLLEVVGLSGSDAVSYLTGETALDDGRYDSDTPYQRLMDDIGRRADRVGGISERGRVVTMRDVSEGRSTLHRHLMNLTLGVDDVRQGREEPLGIDVAAILADPDARFALPDDPQWRLTAAVPTGKVVVAHDPETGYAVFNTYRRRKAGEVLREQRFWWDRDAVPEGVWRPRTDQSEDEQHQAVRELLAALTAAGIDHAVHGQVFTHSEDPVRHEPVPSPELQKEPEPKTDNVPIERLAATPSRENTDGPAEHPEAAGEPAPPSGPDDQQTTAGDTPAEESTGGAPAETSAQVLAGMPRNAGVLFHEAAERGWDVRAERHWTGRAWARRVVITGLVMVPKGLEEVEHVAAWSEDKGGFMSSASSAGFKDVRSAVAAQMPVSREAEESGRTVLGRDAATWVREMTTAAAKITAGLADVRDAYNALDGTGPVGHRAVEIAGAAYREATDAERRAVDAVKAARAWLAESNGEDARGCAAWRRVIVIATQRVTDAAETIAGALDRAECEELAAPVIAEAQDRLNAQEAAWRERLAAEGRTPTARGYGSLIYMLEDSARDWAAWFDGYTDNNGVAHDPQGDASLSMVAQYDAWGAERAARSNGRQVSFPSRYTYASNLAHDRQSAAAVAFALAVGEHIAAPDDDDVSPMVRGTRTLLADIAAVHRNPKGFATANERKHLADWVTYPHGDNYRPGAAGFAEHAPELWEAYETAARAYTGVQHFRHALVWDRKQAAERAEEIRQADAEGLASLTAAREARRLSGREAEEWAAAVERFTTARVRVHEASTLAAGDVERAEACGERVRESDELADDVWSAVRFCREAYDDVHRAKRDADHYAESAEIYREAGQLADYVAECVRMEDAAQRAESGREETLNLYGCAFEDATRAEEARQTACAADVAGQVAAVVEVIAFHQSPGVVGRVVCQCGAVHAGYFPLHSRGLKGEQPSGMADLTDWDIDDALAARGLVASADRDQWSRGVLVTTEDGTAGFATRIPVTMDRRATEAHEASRAERQEATQAATVEDREPEAVDDPQPAEAGTPTDLSPLWAREAVEARTQAIEFAAKGTRQPKGFPVRPVEGERGVWECGGRFYSVSHNGRDESLWGDGYPNTVHDITEVRARRGGFGPAAPIIGHAHGTADARKLIRMYAREVGELITAQGAEAAREAELERIASLSGAELAAEHIERARGMAVAVADAAGPSGELARRTAAAELAAAEAHVTRYGTPQADAETDHQETAVDAETDRREAQLRAALVEGETIVPVSYTDRREPAAGWILTTAAGHTFRLRPVTYARPDEDQWEAGHDADGSHWWAANLDDRPLTAVLARIREDSATRTKFAALWARYGHLTAQAPQFETATDRVQLEEGVYLVRRFGSIGLIASCRWGWEHLTDPDGAQGRTGEDWSRKGPDNRQYVAEWKVWNSAQGAIPNARLRVVAQLTDDMTGTPDAYCDASAPYVGKCSAKRSGARYTVAVVTDQGAELGRYTVCARCLSHRLLNEEDGGDGRTGHRDVQSLAQALAKGDPKVCALHWEQWPDRIAEVAGQMLSAALDAGEVAPWPAQALADQIIAEACEAGDDRAKREARAEVKAAGGDAKAQKRAAEEAAAARQDRAALVAGQGAAGRAFSARIRAESASKETARHLEAGDRAMAEKAAGKASEWAGTAIEAAEAATAAGYGPTEDEARADMEAANEAARAAVATLAGPAGSGVEASEATPEPAEEAPRVVDVTALTVTPQDRDGEPSRYEFSVTGPGLTIGEYKISHDCQGKDARGIIWRAYWHGVEPSGRWDVISIGSGEGKASALAAVAEHAAETGGDLATGFAAARRMRYDAGLWLLPEVGESEAIEYHPDGSWTITAETGALYTVRREWEGRDASNDLAPLLIEDETGALVASCTAVDGHMSAWAPMLERLRLHARAVADEAPHGAAVTLGGPGQSWVEAWCVCGWTERADVAEYADRAPAGEALVLAHQRAHDPETSAADSHAFGAETEHAELPPSAIHDDAPKPAAPAIPSVYKAVPAARAAAVDLAESAWGVECDRHGPVTVWVDMHGETCPQHRAGWCETRADAEHAAALHRDAHARRDADVMTPAEIERAEALGWSAAQSDIVDWVAEGKVGEFPDGFFALDVAYDKPDVSRKLSRNRVLNLWASGRLLVDLDANGARRFTLSPETEAARKLYNQARRLGMIEAAAKDNSFGVSKAERDAYPLMSERRTFDGEEPWQDPPEHDVRIVCHDGDNVSAYNRGHAFYCVCGWSQYRPEADAAMAEQIAAEHANPAPEEAPDAAPVEELRAYMFNAGKAGLFVHVTGPREEHVSADEHVATSASVESFKVEALTGADADTALEAAGWERSGPWDEDRSAPVQRAAPAAEADPAPVVLPEEPLTLTADPVRPALPAGELAETTNGGRTHLQVLETGEGVVPQDTGETKQLGLFGTDQEDSPKPPAPPSSESRTVHRGTLWPGSLVTFTLDDIDAPKPADRELGPLVITGHIYPGYRPSLGTNSRAVLLDAVVRDSAGAEVAAGDIAVQAMPERVLLTPAGHRKDLYPELRGVTAVRVGDLVAEGGARGAAVTAVAYASDPRGASTFVTRDVVTGAEHSFTRLHSNGLSVVPRERRLPKDVAPLFGEHTSHDTALADTHTVLESYQALQAAAALQWPDGDGPQPELRSLHTIMSSISPQGTGAEAYRSNAEAMAAARNALVPVFAQAGRVARYQGHMGRPLHELGQLLDIQVYKLSAFATRLELQAEASVGDAARPATVADVTQTETAETPADEETRPVRRAPKQDEKPKHQEEQDALFYLAQPEAPTETSPATTANADEADSDDSPNDTEVGTPGPGGDRPNTGEGASSDADDRDGAILDDRSHSALNPRGVHASEPLVDEDAAAGPRPHSGPTPGAVSPAVATAPLEDSRTTVPRARPADTPLRPGRLLHADGTPLVLHLSFPDKAATSHPVTAHGAAPAPLGTGEWQVVLDEKGSRMIVHPALISRQDTPRYPGVEDPEEVARWEALDASEATGEDAAVLPARYVRPGDCLAMTRRVKDKEITEYLEVTSLRSHSPGKRASKGLEFTLAGPRGGTRKVTLEPTEHVTIAHPTAHPAVTAPADGRPITTRLLRELWAEGPQIRQVHDPDTLQLIADGQFALHQQTDRSWELLPATTATVIWPSEYIYGFDGEPPWPLAGFPDADQAKEFANHLTTLLRNGGPGSIDFASPGFPAAAQTWRSEDGAPLYLALLGERAAFDRAHGYADSHAATEYLKFESGTRRPQAPAGHQWADRLEAGDVILLEMDDELRPFDIRSRSTSSSGLVTLVLDSDDTVLLARNMTVPSDATQPVTANGAAYADLQAGWAVPEGAWVELDPADLDAELQRSLEHPQLREPGSRVRAKLSARDDDTYEIRLSQIRLVTADQERHTLAQDLVIEQPDLLVRLHPSTAAAEEAPQLPSGQTLTNGSQGPSPDPAPATTSSRTTALPPADQQSGAAAPGIGAVRSEDDTPALEAAHPNPEEIADQQTSTPTTLAPRPNPDKQRRAQEIADAATAATRAEQVRELWEAARSESLPPDTPVDTPDGTKPLRSYLMVRGQNVAAPTAATDTTSAAEHPAPSPDDKPPAPDTPERPEPHNNAEMAEPEPVQEATLYELASSVLGSEQAPAAPTVLADIDGITLYHMVSAIPPETADADDHVGSRWLYLGLTDDTSNPYIPIAVISDTDLSRSAAPDFEHAVSTWAHAAEPGLVNLSDTAAPVGGRSHQEHHAEAAAAVAKTPDEPAPVDERSIARTARQKLPELPQLPQPARRRPSEAAVTTERNRRVLRPYEYAARALRSVSEGHPVTGDAREDLRRARHFLGDVTQALAEYDSHMPDSAHARSVRAQLDHVCTGIEQALAALPERRPQLLGDGPNGGAFLHPWDLADEDLISFLGTDPMAPEGKAKPYTGRFRRHLMPDLKWDELGSTPVQFELMTWNEMRGEWEADGLERYATIPVGGFVERLTPTQWNAWLRPQQSAAAKLVDEKAPVQDANGEPRPPSTSLGPDTTTLGRGAGAHGGTGESDETQLTASRPENAIDSDDDVRNGAAQDNDGGGMTERQSREDSVDSQRQGATAARPEPAPPRADLLQTHPAGTDETQATPRPPVERAQGSRTEGAARREGTNTPPAGHVGTVTEKQGIQAAVSSTEDGARTIRDRLDRPEDHLNALRELFEALAASASGSSPATVSASFGAPAGHETKPARQGMPPALTRARADLNSHIEAINDSPRTTPRLRTELGVLIAQIDQTLPQVNAIHASQRPNLLNRALDLLVRTAERLKDLAARLQAPAASQRIEQLTERLRGSRPQLAAPLLAPRGDQRLQAYATTQSTIETQLATPDLPLEQRHALQEEWLLNRARWHHHYKANHGEPPEGLIPQKGNRIAGYPTPPSLRPRIIQELGDYLRRRARDLSSVPATAAQAELFVILAAAYEKHLPPTSPTTASPQPPLSTYRSSQAADRPDVRAAARRLASEVTRRAAHTSGAALPPRTGDRTVATQSEQQRTVHPASASAARGPSPT
ncbi:hypothetical protein [Streptomyces sp. NPDC102476]|uniref:hypothetical protein n=1 Tax=Streptomyces sp. NPDC102476 TaxID=3366181 RepID=UPI00381266D5